MPRSVIHVSDVAAAQGFAELLEQVRAGAEVIIEHDARPVAVMRSLMSNLDWSQCALVEMDPLRVGGRPVLKGTRMPVEDILANYEYGVSVEEISEQFGIKPQNIRDLLSYAERHNALAHPSR
jgi:uncharacterized protein (DUF433 family)